ncbi:ATP-binding protein [Candidatus Vampirococcus lugosii]|uniref:ATPase, archaeal AAA+ ATPase superfamily n=1 Tax=Candidatus Vampirococcus lugosii TaxID=2789015 RepID=A0ABS5QM59_9BACT|nr:putative ATPase, archaeal AAA+ ATPase superfamily [Candidatus Vampirococcus lugosii]
MIKKLPIGIQSFEIMRTENRLYIDKTSNIINLITKGSKYNFLSRPRRFGKSLLVDTIKYLYEGKKELFEGLYAEKNWNFEKKNPVIKISFGSGILNIQELENKFDSIINNNSRNNNIDINKLIEKNYSDKFFELIRNIYEKTGKKVVVLIDEYDKPILDNITKKEQAKQIRDMLKNFYGILKDSDQYLEFVFITGVSKFSKVSLFSGLNNLEDITLLKEVGDICGYTEQEITDNFQDYLEGIDRQYMKKWYNGFNFLGEEKVYNPFDVLLFLKNKEYKNYWFETATPTFLMKILNESEKFYHIPDLQNLSAGEELIGSFDIEKINIETLLFQTGYLTIKEKIDKGFGVGYKLQIPNKEIKMSLNKYILYDYLGAINKENYFVFAGKIFFALKDGKVEKFIELLKELFSGIAYNHIQYIASYEGYYVSVVYSLLYSIGLDIIQEDITNKGRIDLTIKIGEYIFVIEFKVLKQSNIKEENQAIKQIKERGYSQKYKQNGKQIIELGIDFNFQKRNIENYISYNL